MGMRPNKHGIVSRDCYNTDDVDFLRAIDKWKRANRRMPSWAEVLRIAKSRGWRKMRTFTLHMVEQSTGTRHTETVEVEDGTDLVEMLNEAVHNWAHEAVEGKTGIVGKDEWKAWITDETGSPVAQCQLELEVLADQNRRATLDIRGV